MASSVCSLCGEDSGTDFRSLTDTSPGESTYLSLLEQILEEEEKGLICLLDSGEICQICADMIYSIEIYLQKLRDVKLQIINTYNQYVTKSHETFQSAAEGKSVDSIPKSAKPRGKRKRENAAEMDGKKKQKIFKSDEEVRIFELSYESPTESLNPSLDQPDLVLSPIQSEDKPEFSVPSPTDRPSPKPPFLKPSSFQDESLSILDIILEETSLDTVDVDLDIETWNSVFVKHPQDSDCMAMNWKENLLPSLRPFLKYCDVDLEAVLQEEELPHFSGFCKRSKCSRTLQVRILSDSRLQMEYSAGDCLEPVQTVVKLCDYCLEEFKCENEDHQRSIREHLTVKHCSLEDRVYSCKCGRTFSKKGARNFHYKRCQQDSEQIVTCEYCGKVMRNLAKLDLHKKYCKRDVMCEICNKVFSTGKKLEEHVFTVHNEASINLQGKREHRCEECDKVFWKKYNLDSHRLMHTDIKPFQCDVEDCGRRFKRPAALKHHKETMHEKKTMFYCSFCSSQFKSNKGLKHHISVAHDIGPSIERNFACPHCSKSFRCLADLRVHVVTHTKEKAFTCEICGQKFTRNGSLTEHMMVHMKKFKCEWCDKCFGRERYLKSHLRNCQSCPSKSSAEDSPADAMDQMASKQETVIITKGDNLGPLDLQYSDEVKSSSMEQVIIAKPNLEDHVVIAKPTIEEHMVIAKPNMEEQNIELEKNTNIVLLNASSLKTDGEPLQLIQAPGGQVLALTMLKDCEAVKFIRTGDMYQTEPL